VPIRSRYAYGCDTHFELEIVSGNEASYFVSRYRGRGIPQESECFSFLKLSGHKKLQEKRVSCRQVGYFETESSLNRGNFRSTTLSHFSYCFKGFISYESGEKSSESPYESL